MAYGCFLWYPFREYSFGFWFLEARNQIKATKLIASTFVSSLSLTGRSLPRVSFYPFSRIGISPQDPKLSRGLLRLSQNLELIPLSLVYSPIIAGYLSQCGWRANYYLLLGISFMATLMPFLFLPETYAVVLLRRRAEKLRKETGDEGYMTTQERFKKPFSEVLQASMIRPIVILFMEPIVFLFSVSPTVFGRRFEVEISVFAI